MGWSRNVWGGGRPIGFLGRRSAPHSPRVRLNTLQWQKALTRQFPAVRQAFPLACFWGPCIQVFEDNNGALQLAVNPATKSNSKRIDVRHHFLREHVENGESEISHVQSKYQHADFLTKPQLMMPFVFTGAFMMNMNELIFDWGGGVRDSGIL